MKECDDVNEMLKAMRCVVLQRHSRASAMDTCHVLGGGTMSSSYTRTLFVKYANLTKEKLKSNVRGYKKLTNILKTVETGELETI